MTHGCIVYQEQVIQIFQQLGGYSLGQAGYGAPSHFQEEGQGSRRSATPLSTAMRSGASGAASQTVSLRPPPRPSTTRFTTLPTMPLIRPTPSATRWWPTRRPISGYHYPKEYMAALLTSVPHNSDKVAEYIAECRDCGIGVLPPDVNSSRMASPWRGRASVLAWWPSRILAVALSRCRSQGVKRTALYILPGLLPAHGRLHGYE